MTEEPMDDTNGALRFPLEIRAEEAWPVQGVLKIVIGGLLGAAMLAVIVVQAFHEEDAAAYLLSPGTWGLLLALLLLPAAVVLHGLYCLWHRKTHVITPEGVVTRYRRLRRWRTWSEPLSAYEAVQVQSEEYDVGQGAAHGCYTVRLYHAKASSRHVELAVWGWTAHGMVARADQRAAACQYGRRIAEQLGLPVWEQDD